MVTWGTPILGHLKSMDENACVKVCMMMKNIERLTHTYKVMVDYGAFPHFSCPNCVGVRKRCRVKPPHFPSW